MNAAVTNTSHKMGVLRAQLNLCECLTHKAHCFCLQKACCMEVKVQYHTCRCSQSMQLRQTYDSRIIMSLHVYTSCISAKSQLLIKHDLLHWNWPMEITLTLCWSRLVHPSKVGLNVRLIPVDLLLALACCWTCSKHAAHQHMTSATVGL